MFDYTAKLVDSSRQLADFLAEDIGDSQEKFDEMLTVALQDKYPVSMRAARILALCKSRKQLIRPHIPEIVKSLQGINVVGVKRGLLKILSEMPQVIDEDSIGILTDLSFDWMADAKQEIAIRVYAIDLLLSVVKKYPDLIQEFRSSLETIMEDSSTGLSSRCKYAIRKLTR